MSTIGGTKVYNLGDEKICELTTFQSKTGQVQKYNELIKIHSAENPFVDDEFGHNMESIGNVEELFDQANPDGLFREWTKDGWDGSVEWIRIEDLVGLGVSDLVGDEEVKFMCGELQDSLCRMDIKQGNVADCWFLAALGTVACEKELIDKVVPKDNGDDLNREAGIYHFRFWFQGFWIDVVVDDYLPCVTVKNQTQLIGSSLVKNGNEVEVWVSLVEKAFAKLHGKYENISENWPRYAFENLTGGAIECQSFHDPEQPVPEGFFEYIKKSFGSSTLLALVCQEDNNGVVAGHAYSITNCLTIEKNDGESVDLIRIRNPWGCSEWTGDWSDPKRRSRSLWNSVSKTQKDEIGLITRDDGEFWMSKDDMFLVFEELDICYWSNRATFEGPDSKAKYLEYHGAWSVEQNTAGGIENIDQLPYYIVEISSDDSDCELIYSLGLKQNIKDHQSTTPMGCLVYRIGEDSAFPADYSDLEDFTDNTVDKSSPDSLHRVMLKGYKLEPGKYALLPYLFDEGAEGRFYLRILHTKCSSD